MSNEELQKQIEQLRKDFNDLNEEFYRNNFSAQQDYNKYSNFTTRLKIPHYASLPSTCEVGEIAESGGKLYICATANNWVVSGTQS